MMEISVLILFLTIIIFIIAQFITAQRALYRWLKRKVEEKPERKIAFTLGWIILSFLSVPCLLIIILLIITIFTDEGSLIGVTLLFGWISVIWDKTVLLFQHWETTIKVGIGAALLLTVFHWDMQWLFHEGLFRQKQPWKMRWTASLAGAVVLVMVSGFASMGAGLHFAGLFKSPLVSHQCARPYDSDTKANIHNVYLACKAYWADHGGDKSCDRPVFTSTTYGYIQSRDVRIDATGGENDFRAVATNVQNGHWFRINELGSIIEYQP